MIKIDEIEIIALFCFLFGNGIILAMLKLVISWRTNHRNFDIKMNEMIRQNKQLCTSLIPYVYKGKLEIFNQLPNSDNDLDYKEIEVDDIIKSIDKKIAELEVKEKFDKLKGATN